MASVFETSRVALRPGRPGRRPRAARARIIPWLRWPPFGRLGITMQAQLQTQWCWSAVSTSVSVFFAAASTWTQCTVVNAELGQSTCCATGGSAQCNQPWFLDRALTRTGNLAGWQGRTITMNRIRTQIRRGRPVGVRVGWSGGGGHFLVIAGYGGRIGGSPAVEVRDPIYGTSVLSLATLSSSYQGTGSWTHT